MESRNIDPDNFLMETHLRLLLVPFSPLEGLKGCLFYVTNFSPVYVQVTRWGGSWGIWGWMWAPRNGPVRSAGLGSPCLGGARIIPAQAGSHSHLGPSLLSLVEKSNGIVLGEPEPQMPPLQDTKNSLQASAQHHGGDVPWEAGLSCPESHSWEFDSRNGLSLDSSMTSCKNECGHQDWHGFQTVSSLWASLQKDWKSAHVCGILDASIDTNHSKRKDN